MKVVVWEPTRMFLDRNSSTEHLHDAQLRCLWP